MITNARFKILSFIVFSVLAFAAGAQQYDCNCAVPESTSGGKAANMLVFREYQNPIHNYRGEQFFNQWDEGYIILSNGETINNMTLRYDRFTDELLWLRPGDFVTGVVNKSVIKGFVIYSQDLLQSYFLKRNIRPPGMDTISSFLHVLAEGDLDLLVYRHVVKAVSESRTVDNTIYYIFTDERNFQAVRLRRRSLTHLQGVDTDLMKSVIKNNRLSVNNELNFAKAVYLYNEAGR